MISLTYAEAVWGVLLLVYVVASLAWWVKGTLDGRARRRPAGDSLSLKRRPFLRRNLVLPDDGRIGVAQVEPSAPRRQNFCETARTVFVSLAHASQSSALCLPPQPEMWS